MYAVVTVRYGLSKGFLVLFLVYIIHICFAWSWKKTGQIKKIPIILYYGSTKSVTLYCIRLHIIRFCCLCRCFVCDPIESAQWYRSFVQDHHNFKVIQTKRLIVIRNITLQSIIDWSIIQLLYCLLYCF